MDRRHLSNCLNQIKDFIVPHHRHECVFRKKEDEKRHILDICVGADDVLDLIRVWILEGEAACSDQHPLAILHPEAVHDR